MAFTGNAFCTSAKVGFLSGTYTPLTDTMKIALYTNTATLSITTTVYTVTGEVSSSGTNYTAGGNVLTGVVISFDATNPGTAWITFSNSSWANATFTARGALIYDSSKANAAIAVLDFGSDKNTINTTFTVQMPIASATTALIRIA